MRISDWSSDVCSSDLPLTNWTSRTGWKRLRFTLTHDDETETGNPRARQARYMPSTLNPESSTPAPARHHQQAARPASPAHRSEEHTSELQSLMRISYAVLCLKKKTQQNNTSPH